MLQII